MPERVRYSWRRGVRWGWWSCGCSGWTTAGLDGRVHRGELIVHRDHARRILVVLEKLFKARYPIQRLRLVDAYRADDDRSMAANNTSGFNCRRVSGSSRWSDAFGRAIDLNPLRNPYVTRGGRVSPPAGRPYADRGRRAAGMIGGDAVVGPSPPPAGAGAATGPGPATTSTSPPPAADPGTRGAGPAGFGAEWPGKRDVRGADDAKHRDRPVESDADTGEDDGYAHYARKEEIARAAVLGGTITACAGTASRRCGTRSGSRCARGARLAGMLWGSD